MQKFLRSLLVLVILISVFWPVLAPAQGGRGTISGTVKDSRDSALTSALIELQPLGTRIASDDQGQFRITDVPPGEYTLTVSYVGFAPFTTKIKVDAGQTANVDAVLNVASQSDTVMVTAERLQGEAEAINIERMSENIVQVLPSKVITSLPNTNIADAVGRLPSVTLERDEGEGKYVQIRGTEPRLSNLTIDGVNVPSPEATVRNIKLDIIPADLVERIEVSKTLSANQDADAIGGSVNLVTRTPSERPTYSLAGEGGFTPIMGGRWLDAFSGTVGRRFGEDNRFGALIGGSYDWNGRGIDDIEPSQGTDKVAGKPVAVVNGLDTREYKYYRTRYGFTGGLDYRLSQGSTAYIKGLFSDFHDYGSTWVYSYTPGGIQSQTGNITTFDQTGSMAYREYIRRPDQQIYSILTGARHDLTSTLITYEFAVSRSHVIGGFPTTSFNNAPSNVGFNVDTSNPYRPKYIVTNSVNIFDPTAYSISEVQNVISHTSQLNIQGAASLARRYTLASHLGVFEMGFKIRNAHKVTNTHNLYYSANDMSLTMDKFLGTFRNPDYYDKSYQLGPLTDYNKLNAVFFNNPSLFTFEADKSLRRSDPSNYDATERIYAGYLMNTITFGKVRLQTGLRIEGTDDKYTANQVRFDPDLGHWVTTPIPGSGSYVNVLPTVQLQYQLRPNTNIRASYGMGISRPNFSDIVPSEVINPNASPKSIVIGNPALKATRANNYDLLFEHYFQPLGIIQAGFFYKDLSNPIYNTTVKITSGQYKDYQLQQSINGPNAHIAGFEAAWEQRLSYLPGLLSGFGVSANYSYTASQVSFPTGFSGGRTDQPSLLRQAPHTWNLGFTYDKSRFSMRFGVSHNDTNIYAYNYVLPDPTQPAQINDPIIGVKGPNGDIYLYAHTQFDIQGSYYIGKGVQVVASGLNLSNEVFGFYQGSPRYPIQREYYHPTVLFGLRWTSTRE